MRIIRDISAQDICKPCVATIGFFDGVHLGHRHLIRQVTDEAHRQGDIGSMVVTFDVHPRQVVQTGYRPQLLTTTDEKLDLLRTTGISACALLHFDLELAAMPARDFMKKVLYSRLGVRTLVTGYDNRFGHDRTEGFEQYAQYGREMGMQVVRATAFAPGGANVSSSAIRRLLQCGEVESAARLLGRTYTIGGNVVGGFKVGRKIGFPTANISIDCDLKMLPMHGVYAVEVGVEGIEGIMGGMMDIGTRPTFGGSGTTLEVNIFGFHGDIYGHRATVGFLHRMRPERKFGSAEELAAQLEADRNQAESIIDAARRQRQTIQKES